MKTEFELKNILGKNIKDRRKVKNWSQEYLAEKAAVSKNTISDIESGRKFIKASTLVNIARVLKTEVYELFKPEHIYPDKPYELLSKFGEEVRERIEELENAYLMNLK